MSSLDLVQGSTEWRVARAGSLGASQISDMLARTKSGWGASRANLAAQLVVERLTGLPSDGYVSSAMQWGIDTEVDAKLAYEFRTNNSITPVGLVPHPTIPRTHASPDGLVGDDGLVEVKCPLSASHIETLLGDNIAGRYVLQAHWQMACTGRAWCDFVSFDPRLPETMKLYVNRIQRDDKKIAEIENEVVLFLNEVDATVRALRRRYEMQAAA